MSIGKDKLVYLLVTDKKLQYPTGKSRVAYIGTTKKGVARVSQSIAAKAEEIFRYTASDPFTPESLPVGRAEG